VYHKVGWNGRITAIAGNVYHERNGDIGRKKILGFFFDLREQGERVVGALREENFADFFFQKNLPKFYSGIGESVRCVDDAL
jgi:hypothetical protein